MENKLNFFHRLGVYGFDQVEPLIIAALVSQDPVLLIGKAGTGKTFLLNSISEAMLLEHRHYNASLISFDDLVGFPFPSSDGKSITFLPTPATIWEAESVLVDELSRCKPETQNKFFSIIHERKVQGLEITKLRYRWAAMNPFKFQGGDADDNYEGSQPLDQALADRFAFIIEVPDWLELSTREQEAVIYPAGEAAISDVRGTSAIRSPK
jgi:MoxR-like ATPase